jgi:hypothetical protein
MFVLISKSALMMNPILKKLFTIIFVTSQLLGFACTTESDTATIITVRSNHFSNDAVFVATDKVKDNFTGFYFKENTIISGFHRVVVKGTSSNTSEANFLQIRNNSNLYIAEGAIFHIHLELQDIRTPPPQLTQVSLLCHKRLYKKQSSVTKSPVKKTRHLSDAVYTTAGRGIWKYGLNALAMPQQGMAFSPAKVATCNFMIPRFLFKETFAACPKLTAEAVCYIKHFQRCTFSLPPPQLS